MAKTRKLIRLSNEESAAVKRFADKMAVSESKVGEMWLQDLAADGTSLVPSSIDRPWRLQILTDDELIAKAEAALPAGVTLQDYIVNRINQLNT